MQLAKSYPQFALQLSEWNCDREGIRLVRRAFDECSLLFAAQYRGSGKSFCDHLIGTASGVVLGGGDPSVVAAALVHAAYECGDFGDGRAGDSTRHRRYIADGLGVEVENLVHRYHELGWSPMIAQMVLRSIESTSFTDRSVLLIRVANELDDVVDGGLVVSSKMHVSNYQEETLGIVSLLAERVADAPFAEYVRTVLAEPLPTIRDELILGSIGSRTILPKSVRVRSYIRIARGCRRVLKRGRRVLAGGLIRSGV